MSFLVVWLSVAAITYSTITFFSLSKEWSWCETKSNGSEKCYVRHCLAWCGTCFFSKNSVCICVVVSILTTSHVCRIAFRHFNSRFSPSFSLSLILSHSVSLPRALVLINIKTTKQWTLNIQDNFRLFKFVFLNLMLIFAQYSCTTICVCAFENVSFAFSITTKAM